MVEQPRPFPGATHYDRKSNIYVKATHWKKDGDHPLVERYPIDGRAFKGLIRVGRFEKHALKFGDWIMEDERGRLWVVAGVYDERGQLVAAPPSNFEPLNAGPGVGGAVGAAVGVMLAVLYGWLYGDAQGALPMLFGVTHLMYYTTLLAQWNGSANINDLDEAADDMQVSAHTNTYSINQDTHDFFDDLTNEVTGTNYVAGGADIGSQTLTRSTNTVTFDGADVVWTQSGSGFANARKFVIYRNSGSAATSRLFSVVTADADVGNVTGDLTLAWHANGIAQWSTT